MTEQKTTQFGLLRHGKTEWNSEGRIQGSGNSPLTEEGREGVKEWIPLLKTYGWNRIIASDLGRVKQTVEIINRKLQLPVSFDPRLQEQHWGDWEGLKLSTIRSEMAEELSARIPLGWDFSAPGGETRRAVNLRTKQALLEYTHRYPGEKILIVCHQGVIKCLLYELTNRKFVPEEDALLNHNALHLLKSEEKGFSIIKLNIFQSVQT